MRTFGDSQRASLLFYVSSAHGTPGCCCCMTQKNVGQEQLTGKLQQVKQVIGARCSLQSTAMQTRPRPAVLCTPQQKSLQKTTKHEELKPSPQLLRAQELSKF
uniref:Uncharacterized protein n=1 Tax=Gallus gallus TaxID=9031 RepID=A0A8V0Z1S2_CHICK